LSGSPCLGARSRQGEAVKVHSLGWSNKVGQYKQFEFIDPFWTDYYFAYLDDTNEQPKLAGLSADAAATVLNLAENAAVYAALAIGAVTNTGLAYQEYFQTNPPSLNLTPSKSNSLNLDWTPVADHYLLEQSSNLLSTSWTSIAFPARSVGANYSASASTTNKMEFFLRLP
jgi:hypothetical protein